MLRSCCKKQSDQNIFCAGQLRRRSPSQLAIDARFLPPVARSEPCPVLGQRRG